LHHSELLASSEENGKFTFDIHVFEIRPIKRPILVYTLLMIHYLHDDT